MYYYTFKAISKKDGKVFKEYLYNEAVEKDFNKDLMMTIVKAFIKKDLEEAGYSINDFTFTKKLQPYKDFRERFDKLKFINNRKHVELEPVSDDLKQTEESKERHKSIAEKRSRARLPKSVYGAWATPRDPNSKSKNTY